jgi:N12 class adenine-specific DNA methylase
MTATTALAASSTDLHSDFRFDDSDDLSDLGGPASRFKHNVAALTLLKRLEAESRAPGDLARDEQRTLARYTGWGDSEVLKHAFPAGAYSWARPCDELAALLDEEETKGVLGSTLNAHYTALPVIRAIYAALEHSGLDLLPKLRVLEPAAGVGHFFGAMPEALALKSERVAVELDSLTGRILRHLYPKSKVFIQGYETTALPRNYFDLIVSNVPFGNYGVHDPQVKHAFLKAAIHDYYFARSLTLARPGGVIAFITSRFTLDKANMRVRRYLAEHAELLAAARLPASAFRKNAGTEVVADVVILRKRPQPVEAGSHELNWVELGEFTLENSSSDPVTEKINALFAARPQLMLGVPCVARGMHHNDEFTLRGDGRDLAAALRESLVSQLPAQSLANGTIAQPIANPEDGSVEKESAGAVQLERLSGTARHRASALLDIYMAAKQVIKLQLLDADDEALRQAQRELGTLYDGFKLRYGYINARQNLKDLDPRSPLVPFLKALEEPAGQNRFCKSAIFTRRTIRPAKQATSASTPKDALLLCLNESGRVDLERICSLTGQSADEVLKSLQGFIYQTPDGEFQTAEEYLSGSVVAKLREARAAADLDTAFRANVEALEAVQPPPLGAEEIAARLGSGWIPAEIINLFIKELIPQFGGRICYIPSLGAWKIEGTEYFARTAIEATQTWGTMRLNAIDLIDDVLNLRTPTVYDEKTVGNVVTRVVNEAETIAAQAKLAEIKLKFAEWVWQDKKRAEQLIAIYNERYNCLRARRYDGSHLQLPGMNTSVGLRAHQKDGIWRILQSKATLIGHCVGAGKTYLMIAAAMELKRLGLAHKSLVVVPNHLPAQWEKEARHLYPNIKLLVPSKAELSQSQRGELMSRIATGDYDLIIVPHSAFKLLPTRPETAASYIQREIDALREYLEEIPQNERSSNRKTVKEIQKAIKKLEVKLQSAVSGIQRDSAQTVMWEELGVDALFIDEAHMFKNLYLPTKMTRVAGLPNSDSQRAFDAFIKVRSLLDDGKRLIFATATPVSNTLAEVYVMMKFLQLDTLEELGLAHFDAWVQMFAETTQSLEMKPDGSGFRMNTRFNKFTNLPELAALWRQALDVKTPEQLNLPRPSVAGGGPQVISIPASDALKGFVKQLAARVENIRSRRVKPDEDNMLKITSEGRKAALDVRLVLPGTPAPVQSKITALTDKIVEFYHQSRATKGVQLCFCDISVPKAKNA